MDAASGTYKVRFAAPPGAPQPEDAWVPSAAVTAEQVESYRRKIRARDERLGKTCTAMDELDQMESAPPAVALRAVPDAVAAAVAAAAAAGVNVGAVAKLGQNAGATPRRKPKKVLLPVAAQRRPSMPAAEVAVAEVSEEPKKKKKKKAPAAGEPQSTASTTKLQARTLESEQYSCDKGCGFRGAFNAVAAHEAGCEANTSKSMSRQQIMSKITSDYEAALPTELSLAEAAALDVGRKEAAAAAASSEKDAKLAQKLSQPQPFTAVSHRNAWPACTFWVNLTPLSLQRLRARG
jgi:hypothetical protein